MNVELQVNERDAKNASLYRVLHVLPTRWRIHVDGLQDNEDFSGRFVSYLSDQGGIGFVRANSITGNAIVAFEPGLHEDQAAGAITDAILLAHGLKRSTTPRWWELAAQDTCDLLETRHGGLTEAQISGHRSRFGANVVTVQPKESDLVRVARQFQSLPIALLCGSALVSVLTGGIADAVLISAVVAANVAIGFVSERKAEAIIDSFIKHDRPNVLVRRDGTIQEIPAETLVVGDLLILTAGQTIAADARVVQQSELAVDESLLTGESAWVSKTTEPIDSDAVIAERTNMVHAGTMVVAGRGVAVVVAVGRSTEIGRIGIIASETRQPKTSMQVQLDRLGAHLTWASVLSAGCVFGLGFLRGMPLASLLRTSVALAIAAIPEGLPAAATSILAFGLREMQRNHVLIRRLDAVETLGSVSIVCFDKTGTLTQNRMAATDFLPVVGEEEGPRAREMNIFWMLQIAVLCNESQVAPGADNHVINGSSTENALLLAAIEHGLDVQHIREAHPLAQTIHRNGKRRYMMTCHTNAGGVLVAIKGSPMDVLRLCAKSFPGEELSETDLKWIAHDNESATRRGLRVLGFAMATGATPDDATEYRWLGMIGLSDPVRPGMSELMDRFHSAGIRTVMATGDQAGTAMAIANETNLAPQPIIGVSGHSVEQMTPEHLAFAAEKVSVYARVNPLDKLQIVRGMQRSGAVVAMIGDGANDGPALRASDVGISFGIAGTDAARDTADVLLGKDDMEMMVIAVRHGRSVYANIRKAIHFLVGTNSSELMLTLSAVALGAGNPLNPAQLLWMNLVTDVAIALSLGFEPPESDVMQHPPRPRDEPIIAYKDFGKLLRKGALYSGSALAAHLYGMTRYGATGGGVGFMTLIGSQLLDGLSSRSDTQRAWNLPSNPYLTRSLLGLTALQAGVCLVPGLRSLLGIAAFDLFDLAVIAAGSTLPFLAVETTKPTDTADQVRPPNASRDPHLIAGAL